MYRPGETVLVDWMPKLCKEWTAGIVVMQSKAKDRNDHYAIRMLGLDGSVYSIARKYIRKPWVLKWEKRLKEMKR